MCLIEGDSGWALFLGWLLFAILIGSITTLIVLLIRRIRVRDEFEEIPNALAIAKQRYARGEISREEFEQIKKDLA
jgi:putative membrane protein